MARLVSLPRSFRPRSSGPRSARALLGLFIAAFVLSSCTGGPGDRDDLVTALTRDDSFTVSEAECIADAVFLEYGEDDDAIGKISGSSTYEELVGSEGVAGFSDFFDNAISVCANTG